MKTIHFFLDFDGTVSSADVVDVVLERFADKAWKDVEKEWQEGRIGSRECLSRQIRLIRATPEDLREEVSRVKLDPYFVSFLKTAEELGVLVTIVSDGFDVFIEQVLKNNLQETPALIKAVPIYSNKLIKTAEGYEAVFLTDPPCVHGCANCKAALIKRMTSPDDHIFFVGDGLSDRYAAQQSHLTFAKGKLSDFCKKNGIDHITYNDFKKVQEWLLENHPLLKKTRFARS